MRNLKTFRFYCKNIHLFQEICFISHTYQKKRHLCNFDLTSQIISIQKINLIWWKILSLYVFGVLFEEFSKKVCFRTQNFWHISWFSETTLYWMQLLLNLLWFKFTNFWITCLENIYQNYHSVNHYCSQVIT